MSAWPFRKRADRRRREGGRLSVVDAPGRVVRLPLGTVRVSGVIDERDFTNRREVELRAHEQGEARRAVSGGAGGVEHRNQRALVADFAEAWRRLRRQEREPSAAVGWDGSGGRRGLGRGEACG